MNLSERAAYIKGLADGLELDTDKKEARVLREMLDLLTDMAASVEDMGDDVADLFNAVESLDEDLAVVEDEVFDGGTGMYGEDVYEIECPNCHDTVTVDEDMLVSGDVVCPGCGEKIEIEIDDCDCDECGGKE